MTTNSITSPKCPTTLSSGTYGMSQNHYTDDSKEYIFVKLTDSALRAIDEYQVNENSNRLSNGQCLKIRFLGNSGVIQFPSTDSQDVNSGREFSFAIDDVEGSLECIQQSQNTLDVLGSLSYRMRILANEDVYDTTRTKMAIAEETEKSKCIREIKPNQTDIGRKVKRPVSAATAAAIHGLHGSSNSSSSYLGNSSTRNKLIPSTNSSGTSKISSTTSISRSPNRVGGNSVNTLNSNSRYGNQHQFSSVNSNSMSSPLTNASSLSSTLSGAISNSYSPISHNTSHDSIASTTNKSHKPSNSFGNPSARSSNLLGMKSTNSGFNSNSTSSAKTSSGSGGGGTKSQNIARRGILERLIHLLALRPFKKPELYLRLKNEGIRDSDICRVNSILKDIATLSRDNTYNLRHHMWNDVNENWPFYSEQELQDLKRRKPQNLTPPLSSDAGSSTSGQSPTSTHTGSPPPLIANATASGMKRTNSLESDRYDIALACGIPAKKQRISHFKKDNQTTTTSSNVGGSAMRMGYNNNYRNTSSFSPHGSQHSASANTNTLNSNANADDNFGNADLSYNVLENADEFMSHVEQSSLMYNGDRNKSQVLAGSANAIAKDKRNAGGNNKFYNSHDRNSINNTAGNSKDFARKKSSPSPLSGSFVAETKSSGGRNTTDNKTSSNYRHPKRPSSANSSQNQQIQTQLNPPNQPKSTSISNNSSTTHASPSNRADTTYSSGKSVSSGGNSRYNKTSPSIRPAAFASLSSRSPPDVAHYQQQTLIQSQPAQPPPQPPTAIPQQSLCTQNPSQGYQQLESPTRQQREQQHSSPTQVIAAAASSYSSSNTSNSKASTFDFSTYTPIQSLDQRRRYKTEFENDYVEYLRLLEQIEGVGRRFRGLADRLESVPKGCADFNNIKQQIVSEYERINNEESIRRNKQRFDYLHEKLAHIKQLVTDYDKALTNTQLQQQKALQLQQQQAALKQALQQQQVLQQQQQILQQQQKYQQQQFRVSSPGDGTMAVDSSNILNGPSPGQQQQMQYLQYKNLQLEQQQSIKHTGINAALMSTNQTIEHPNAAKNDDDTDSDDDSSTDSNSNDDDDEDDDDDDDEDSNSGLSNDDDSDHGPDHKLKNTYC